MTTTSATVPAATPVAYVHRCRCACGCVAAHENRYAPGTEDRRCPECLDNAQYGGLWGMICARVPKDTREKRQNEDDT